MQVHENIRVHFDWNNMKPLNVLFIAKPPWNLTLVLLLRIELVCAENL